MVGGILDRLFQKPGSGRPAEIAQALKSKDPDTEDYRRVAAACLAGLTPGNITSRTYITYNYTFITYNHTYIHTYIQSYIHTSTH